MIKDRSKKNRQVVVSQSDILSKKHLPSYPNQLSQNKEEIKKNHFIVPATPTEDIDFDEDVIQSMNQKPPLLEPRTKQQQPLRSKLPNQPRTLVLKTTPTHPNNHKKNSVQSTLSLKKSRKSSVYPKPSKKSTNKTDQFLTNLPNSHLKQISRQATENIPTRKNYRQIIVPKKLQYNQNILGKGPKKRKSVENEQNENQREYGVEASSFSQLSGMNVGNLDWSRACYTNKKAPSKQMKTNEHKLPFRFQY